MLNKKKISLSNLLTMNVHDEGYSRNTSSCTLDLSWFLFILVPVVPVIVMESCTHDSTNIGF
jgi:hypothetical protein